MKKSNYYIYIIVLFLSLSFGCGPEEVTNEVGNYQDEKKMVSGFLIVNMTRKFKKEIIKMVRKMVSGFII